MATRERVAVAASSAAAADGGGEADRRRPRAELDGVAQPHEGDVVLHVASVVALVNDVSGDGDASHLSHVLGADPDLSKKMRRMDVKRSLYLRPATTLTLEGCVNFATLTSD